MCTLILATHLFEDSAVFLASNRDESLARPSTGPLLWDEEETRFVAPRDEQEGGTWLGVNEHRVLVAITNRFGRPRLENRRSRGELVLLGLREESAVAASERIAAKPPTDYNPFHLVFADDDGAFIVWSDGQTMYEVTLDPGVHVVTERSFGAADNGRATFIEDAVSQMEDVTRDKLAALLRVTGEDDPDVTCISIPRLNYGTRSSALVDTGRRELLYADGPPCKVDYDVESELLDELLG